MLLILARFFLKNLHISRISKQLKRIFLSFSKYFFAIMETYLNKEFVVIFTVNKFILKLYYIILNFIVLYYVNLSRKFCSNTDCQRNRDSIIYKVI